MPSRDETPTQVFPTVTTPGRTDGGATSGNASYGGPSFDGRSSVVPSFAGFSPADTRPRRPIPAHRIVLLVAAVAAIAALLASIVPNAIARHRLASACSSALSSWTDQHDRISELVSKADRTSVRVTALNKLSVTSGFDESTEGSSILTAVSQSRNRAASALAAGVPACTSRASITSIRSSTRTMTVRADMLANSLNIFDTQLRAYQKEKASDELSSALSSARERLDAALDAGDQALADAQSGSDGDTASTTKILALKGLLATGRTVEKGADALQATSPSTTVRQAVSALESTATKISDAAAALTED